ncbi:MAG: cytochrome b6-f complex subunit PetM [Cyanobacteria bacterium]|nr:cytochrome b6-f complex subunit PetM [Cyanobacteriota bacterium]
MASEIFSTAFLTMILILIGLGAGFLLLKIEGSRP